MQYSKNGCSLFLYSDSYDDHVRKKKGNYDYIQTKIGEIFMGHNKRRGYKSERLKSVE